MRRSKRIHSPPATPTTDEIEELEQYKNEPAEIEIQSSGSRKRKKEMVFPTTSTSSIPTSKVLEVKQIFSTSKISPPTLKIFQKSHIPPTIGTPIFDDPSKWRALTNANAQSVPEIGLEIINGLAGRLIGQRTRSDNFSKDVKELIIILVDSNGRIFNTIINNDLARSEWEQYPIMSEVLVYGRFKRIHASRAGMFGELEIKLKTADDLNFVDIDCVDAKPKSNFFFSPDFSSLPKYLSIVSIVAMVSGRDGNECCLTDVEGKSIGCKTFISNKFSSRLFSE